MLVKRVVEDRFDDIQECRLYDAISNRWDDPI